MKAPIAQAGGEAASPPGCPFLFFWGLEIGPSLNFVSNERFFVSLFREKMSIFRHISYEVQHKKFDF